MSNESIIRRINALMAKTVARGCTEAEALAAAEMVGRMMDEHDLSMSDLKIQSSETVRSTVKTGKKSENQAPFLCVNAIAFFTDTKAWCGIEDSHGSFKRTVEWFGFKPDVIVAEYLYAIIDRALVDEYLRWDFKGTKGDKDAFWSGMAARISQRLRQMKDARNKYNESTGRSLVIVKSATVAAAFEELGIGLRAGRGRSRSVKDSNAYYAGHEAGNRVQLHSGVGAEARNKLT